MITFERVLLGVLTVRSTCASRRVRTSTLAVVVEVTQRLTYLHLLPWRWKR